MKKDELLYIIKEYYDRSSRNNNDNKIGLNFAEVGNTSKFLNYRGRQLDVFLSDAKLLKDITYTNKETACSNPPFKSNSIQYYFLTQNELLNYFAFRTLVQNGKRPNNDHCNFLLIYVMEIVNGIYQDEFKAKYKLLTNVKGLFPKGAKYKNILIEAFEILYFQYMDSLDFDKYCKDVPLNIFTNIEFFQASDIPVVEQVNYEGMLYGVYVPPLTKIIKLTGFKKDYPLNDTDLYLLEQCYNDVIKTLDESGELNYNNDIKTKSILECSIKEKHDTPFVKLKVNFSLATNVNYRRKSSNLEVIRYGLHCLYVEKYQDERKLSINQFLFFIIELLRYYCGNIPLKKTLNRQNWSSYYINPHEEPKFRELMMNVVKNWVENNGYVKDGLNLSPKELEEKKAQKDFKLDISDITTVRKKSDEIQNKLIVDEKEIHLKINNVQTTINNNILKDSVSPTNEFELFILALNPFECDILSELIRGNVKAASKIATANGSMLSIEVDNINLISNELIEDVVIIDDAVLDYGKELKKALKILN
jgi:hypothetical protein